MKQRADEERLALYRQSLIVAWGYIDYNDWPIKLNSVFHLFLEEFGAELLADIDALENDHSMSPAQIASLFYNPARIYRIIDSTIYSLRRRRTPLAEQRKQVIRLLNLVCCIKTGSEFNEDGRNIILSDSRTREIGKNVLGTTKCSIEESQLVHRFAGMMWAYTESIFFRAHDVTKEIHGPYDLDDKQAKLIVKEYLNLRPHHIWPNGNFLPYDRINLYLKYNKNVNMRIDALNHLYEEGAGSIDNLETWAIMADGRQLNIEELRQMIEMIQETILDNSEAVDQLDMTEKITKYAEIFWFRKSPLRTALNLPWSLPDSIKQKIAAGGINPQRIPRLTKEQVCRLAKLTI